MAFTDPITIRLEPELLGLVQKQADMWHCSISQAIRNMVHHYFEEGARVPMYEGDLEESFKQWLGSEAAEKFLKERMAEILLK